MNLTEIWKDAQKIERIKDLTLEEWLTTSKKIDCSLILSPDEEFYIHDKGALQLYFWNYIEHKEQKALRWRQHQLGYVWFKRSQENITPFYIPQFTPETDPDYHYIILERLELLAAYIRPHFNHISAGIVNRNKVTEISLQESLIPLYTPEEIIQAYYDENRKQKIREFIP